MKRYVVLDKKSGETPLVALTAWKAAHPDYAGVSASYAGRLDPMASGKLLILLGDECKKQATYTDLDKEYEIEVLLDIGSDTGDALGLITYSAKQTRIDGAVLRSVLNKEVGAHMRPYPRFSSKTVNGKQLFLYALEGTLDSITIPEHEEHIYGITVLDTKRIAVHALHERINSFLARVPTTDEPSKALGANFRIDQVRAGWEELFATDSRDFALITLRVICGSGTYMRSLAGRIGEALGTNALALSIHRTKIGKRFGPFWLREYS